MTTPVAGWYPMPDRPGTEGYWDGAKWTRDKRPIEGFDKKQHKEAQQAAKEAAAAQQAFDRSPAGQALAARAAGHGFFEIQLQVGSSQRDSTIFGGNNFANAKNKTASHAGTLSAIEAVGWKLEHVGHVFQVTSESSREKFLATGQQTAVSGVTVGIYLFRAVD